MRPTPRRHSGGNKYAFHRYLYPPPCTGAGHHLLILLAGVSAIFSLPIRQYPFLENAEITVSTTFPGATQEVMQGFVTTPIAQSIATAAGIEYLTSSSTPGSSQITARLVLNANADRAMTEILAKVQQVKYRLPTGAYDPVITKSTVSSSAVNTWPLQRYVVYPSGDRLCYAGGAAAVHQHSRGRLGGLVRRAYARDAHLDRPCAPCGARPLGR